MNEQVDDTYFITPNKVTVTHSGLSDTRFTSYDLWLSSGGLPNGLRLNANDGSQPLEWGISTVIDTEPDES